MLLLIGTGSHNAVQNTAPPPFQSSTPKPLASTTLFIILIENNFMNNVNFRILFMFIIITTLSPSSSIISSDHTPFTTPTCTGN